VRPAIALAALLTLVAAGCGPGHAPAPRTVVVGIDGADWALVDALAAEGRMPHLQGLRERGSWGRIQTLADIPLSPAIWTSVVTGKVPAKHGIGWFLVDQPDGSRTPVRSHNRRAKALWNVLAERGLRTISIGWWASYPAEDIGPGLLVSDALGFHGFGRTAREGDDGRKTHPPELFARVSARLPVEQQIDAAFATRFLHLSPDEYREERFDPARGARRDPTSPIHLFQQYAVTAQGYTAIAEDLLAEPFDLFLVYYEQVDSFSHLFMKYAPPKLEGVTEAEFARYRDAVRAWYAYQDELLGRLLAKIDLDTTAVFVLSDHGFKTGARRIASDDTVDLRRAHLEHEPEGILVAAGPGIRRGHELDGASVLDVTPTLLAYLGQPVGRDMDGKVLTGLFEEAVREARPIRYVASYEDGAEPPSSAAHGDAAARELAERLAALEALGYVAADPDEETTDPAASSPELHNNVGRAHLGRGEIDAARAEFQRALALDPRNADALLNLGLLERLRGNAAGAEHLAQRALQANPSSVAALVQLAELRRDAGELDESIRLYREARALDDAQPFVHLGLGDSLQRAGRYPEAEAAFRAALALDPDAFEAHYDLGVTAFNQGHYSEAIGHYEKALGLDADHPEAPSALNNLGSSLLALGREEEARARFEEAARTGPGHVESRYNLAALDLRQGRLDAAIARLEEAAALAPSHETVHVALAGAYLHAARNEDALRALLLVRRLYPENWYAPLGLAALHAASEREDEAQELFAEALRLGGDAARAEAKAFPVLEAMLAGEGVKPAG